MRGEDMTQEELLSVRTLEEGMPKKHPLRQLRAVIDVLLRTMDADFAALYAKRRARVDSARALPAGQLVASAVLGAFGAATGVAD